MEVYVMEHGPSRKELLEALKAEGVSFQERKTHTEREAGSGGIQIVEIQANLSEVVPVPPEYTQGSTEVRAWRLPSGKLVITDMEGNLDRIAGPPPRY